MLAAVINDLNFVTNSREYFVYFFVLFFCRYDFAKVDITEFSIRTYCRVYNGFGADFTLKIKLRKSDLLDKYRADDSRVPLHQRHQNTFS